ncbi:MULTISPECIES: hypothetical protein [Bacteroidaceae]|uniref:hypothetical protein n=1 Tax=Bacteroidaceae TaxID=815 RepID=UPI00189AFA44|nr:hypothetical protein [Bacteroides ovatus]MCE9167434.1 hypothetical protein [Bacteroides ovatus]
MLITKKAQTIAIRFTVHHKPQLNMGCLRPYGCSPNISCCSFTCGGDCEAIEQYVLDIGFPNPNTKV